MFTLTAHTTEAHLWAFDGFILFNPFGIDGQLVINYDLPVAVMSGVF